MKRECKRRVRQGAHEQQMRSHRPTERPNHLYGIPSGCTTRGPSIVPRKEANDDTW